MVSNRATPASLPSSEDKLSPDIVVAGGGMAGVMAALAAKSATNRVLIVEPSNVVGGQGTAGGVAGFCGDTANVNRDFQELIGRLSAHRLIRDFNPTDDRRSYDLEWCAFFLQEMLVERGIDVLLHTRVVGAEAHDGFVTALDLSTAGGLFRIRPKFVIDATGSCVVPAMAGFPVTHEGANKQLPMSLYFTMWDTGKPVRPFLPPSCREWQNDTEIPMTTLHCFDSGKVEIKMKVVGFDAADGWSLSAAELFARRQMMSLIYFLQTKGFRGKKLDHHVLASVSRHIGIREARGIVGEHCLTLDEVTHATVFADAVAVGTFHLDFHWPDKAERGDTGITTMVEPYHIPLRAMIPKGARNILVPGRGACGDQMAMSSFRVMAPVSQMGFAAGKAAQLCADAGSGIDGLDVRKLQETIEAGGQRLDLSAYGIYLRNSLVDHEQVFGADQAISECRTPTIVQLRNNRFLTAWVANSGDSTAIWLADRFQCAWSAPRTLAKVGDAPHWTPELFVGADGRVVLTFRVGPTEADAVNWSVESDDEGLSWSQSKPVADAEATGARGFVSGAKTDRVRIREGLLRAYVPPRIDGESEIGLRLSYSSDNGEHWSHSIDLKDPVEGVPSEPAIIGTPRGVAVAYVTSAGRIAFWHGSIEQVIDRDAIAKHTASLHCGIMP